MAIDDPVGIVIRQADEEIEAKSYLPARLIELGLSAGTAAALAKWPFITQIIWTLLTNSSVRFEKRFLLVAKALNDQQKRIEDKIPNRGYYESEEFQTLMGLLLERLHTTQDNEKLNMFGKALANSGSSDFQEDDREEFIRILRDLSLKDLDELKMFAPPAAHELNIGLEGTKRFLLRRGRRDLGGENLSRTTRLIGLGLVKEEFSMRNFTGSVEYRSANEIRRAISDYLKQPPTREYELTWFGWRFLQFVSEDSPPTNSDALNITSEANGL